MANDLQTRLQSQAVQQQNPNQPPSQEAVIRSMESQFKMAMPRGKEAAQLVRDALTVVRQNPKLAECSQDSLLGSLMTCAQLGLRPGIGALGQAYILPFWNGKKRRQEAQFVIGYQGMLDLANRSGEIDYVTAEMVCKNDEFRPDPMSGRHKHEIPISGGRGDVIGYYCIFFRKGSDRGKLLYMSKEDMEAHRDKFATAKNHKTGQIFGPWADHFDAMALKTVVRMNFKFMPKSTDIENALVADETIRLDATPTADLVQVSERPNAEDMQPAPQLVNTQTGEISAPSEPPVDPWHDNAPSAQEQEAIFAAEREGR